MLPVTTTVRINELLPVPAQDGVFDGFEEWIELFNSGSAAVDLSGWFLDDGLDGSDPYRIPDETVLLPGGFILFHGRTTAIVLDDAGDEVRLLDPVGSVVDSVIFGQLLPNASYSRDDVGGWYDDWMPSPGGPNLSSGPAPLTGMERLAVPGGVAPRSLEPKRLGGVIP
jgi:hypothetical protein